MVQTKLCFDFSTRLTSSSFFYFFLIFFFSSFLSFRLLHHLHLLLLLLFLLVVPAVPWCHGGCAEVDSRTEAVAGQGFLLGCIFCKRREEVSARSTVDWHFKPLGEEQFRHVSSPMSSELVEKSMFILFVYFIRQFL